MPAYVVVQLAKSQGKSAGRRSTAPLTSRKLKRVLAAYDAVPVSTPELASDSGDDSTMTVVVPDMDRANQLAAALREMDDVDTAYAKPAEELP